MHSSVYRKTLVAMACALVLGVVGSASASASSWWAGGSKLASSEPLASSTTKVARFEILINTPGEQTVIECENVSLKGADIASPSDGSIEHLVLKECKVNPYDGSGPYCHLASETIESKALKLEAKLGSKSPEDDLVVKPASGVVLAEISFPAGQEQCPFSGKKPVSLYGEAQLVLPKGREEAVEQSLQFRSSEIELSFGGDGAKLEGEYKLKLSSGKAWSYH